MMRLKWIPMLAMVGLLSACGNDAGDEPTTTEPTIAEDNAVLSDYLNIDLGSLDNYEVVTYPTHYNADVLANSDNDAVNTVTDMGATLGRVLFYDKRLSTNNTVACASCHIQELGFTDDKVLSEGFEGGLTGAHSMRIANANFYTGRSMFWDKRASSIEDQSTQPIQDGIEMGFDEAHGGFTALIEKLDEVPYYPVLFRRTFGDETITEARVQLALGQFMRSMVSIDSKFDQGYASVYNTGQPGNGIGGNFPNYNASENLGKSLFLAPPNAGGAGCAGCHQPPTFALDADSRSNGLDAGETTIFKSPSLKNVAVAGPYMHGGTLATLSDVVAHYNDGIQAGPALDPRLTAGGPQDPTPIRMNLTAEEQAALVAFLETLTDNTLLADGRFASPFK